MKRPLLVIAYVSILISMIVTYVFFSQNSLHYYIYARNDLRTIINAIPDFLNGKSLYKNENGYTGYIYPPLSIYVFVPLSYFDALTAFLIFTIVGWLIYFIGTVQLIKSVTTITTAHAGLIAAIPLLFYPSMDNLFWGQSQLLIVGLISLGLTQKSDIVGGLLLGLVTYYKVYPLIIIGCLILNRDYRRAIYALIFFALFVVISVFTFGIAEHLRFLDALAYVSNRYIHIAQSLKTTLQRFAIPNTVISVLPVLYAVYFLILYKLNEQKQRLAFGLLSVFILNQIIWRNYYVIIIPIAILLYPTVAQKSHYRASYVLACILCFSSGLDMINLSSPAVASIIFSLPMIGVGLFFSIFVREVLAQSRQNRAIQPT